jgi:hypothetical protein
MKRQEAVEFLTSQGHLFEIEEIDENIACVWFRYRGKSLALYTTENDPMFFFLKCTYDLEDAERDELFVLRAIKKLEQNYKLAKIGYHPDGPFVYATAEQFVPDCPEFTGIFWRTAGLVSSAAADAWKEVNAIVIADYAAERFTAQLEAELHGKAK